MRFVDNGKNMIEIVEPKRFLRIGQIEQIMRHNYNESQISIKIKVRYFIFCNQNIL